MSSWSICNLKELFNFEKTSPVFRLNIQFKKIVFIRDKSPGIVGDFAEK